MKTNAHEHLLGICRRWSAAAAGSRERLEYFGAVLPDLLMQGSLFGDILAGICHGSGFPDVRLGTLFDNEFVLFQDPGRAFSLRMFIFGPGEKTPIHDHSAWGVLGSAFGQLEVVKYRREDDGSEPEHARLCVADCRVLAVGEIDTALPFDEGIHRTGSPAGGATLMVNIYGFPGRRLHIHCFDMESGRVQRLYPQRIRKRMLAELALAQMGAP
jgi:predicted metal-dependent enzyme (double-stranded beta helix superfamily)